MSVQFGRWNIDGKPVDRDYLEKARATIAPYGPDEAGSYLKGNISILYHAFHTTKESRRETQPHLTASGAVITWDGRLDNRAELIGQLKDGLTFDSTDVSIVAAAYEEWGTGCFARLIGDWALSVWSPNSRSLILAKDPIGTRHLYYAFDKNQVTWSTILDPLVLFAGRAFALEEEYIAGWLSFFPATHLTPYVGIHSVSPSCFVIVEPERQTISRYWDFDPAKKIRYRTDGEYEEHFRAVFAEAVRRRLRSDNPILRAKRRHGFFLHRLHGGYHHRPRSRRNAAARYHLLQRRLRAQLERAPLFHKSGRETRPHRLPHRRWFARVFQVRIRQRPLRCHSQLGRPSQRSQPSICGLRHLARESRRTLRYRRRRSHRRRANARTRA